MRSVKPLFVVVVAAVFGIGCSSLDDVVREKQAGGGTARTYAVTFDQAWEISRTVFRWEGADQIEEHKDQKYMLTSSGMNFVSAGAVMGAWIEPLDEKNTRVTVITKRRMSTNIATTLTESTYQKTFAQAVQIVLAGKPLPLTKPAD